MLPPTTADSISQPNFRKEDANSTDNVEVGPTGPKGAGTDHGNIPRFFGGTE
jgi:hypothetical protein